MDATSSPHDLLTFHTDIYDMTSSSGLPKPDTAPSSTRDTNLEGVVISPFNLAAPYDPSIPVEHRLARAIHRFRKKRSLVPSGPQYEIFKSYMAHGGVDVGCKSFVKNPQPDEMDSDGDGPPMDQEGFGLIKHLGSSKYQRTIDFTGLIREFLSTEIWFTTREGDNQESIEVAGPVLAKFLTYLQMHQVCPEYEEDIKNALEVANIATTQLPLCHRLSVALPSSRDKSLSAYYGGRLAGQLDENGAFFPLKKREALLRVTREEMLSWRLPGDSWSWNASSPKSALIKVEGIRRTERGIELIGRVIQGEDEKGRSSEVRLHVPEVVFGEDPFSQEVGIKDLLIEGEFGILRQEKGLAIWVLERLLGVWPSYTPRTSDGWVSLAEDRNGW
ncbi:Argonaute siRNA chaperone complex subunit Arb1-domain-containing protein [Piptocephalis cylindrospora]|uniref:Argonaute siRNA chaperone complex subunit Arb1-domain-containing protein n=1 Tax=Piptocephalis cylindrospora TaxID=1907219 RepID=A0A4P9Y480_9FUNG|nr:Argonaute siRNA chaperone complex subunit Arb1-domain-containing protein [Piptocephalis cylindrospora]|eukprot:RKP13462.1 Argonaute siRNA chaperone complex subunit Arb1-domain-containing protein [Piptocephalis cylindrospora]